jgi:predicted metal-dependent hydrolase
MLTDERAQQMLGASTIRSLLLWHAYEESEHKAVAFDVYRAVGGTERRRIRVMRCTTLVFTLCIARNTLVSLVTDRDTRNLARLVRSIAELRHSPFLNTRTLERIRAYNTPGFHPNDVDTADILAKWHPELFSVSATGHGSDLSPSRPTP